MIRYLCSELVFLRRSHKSVTVNLEEIWTDGASVELDEAIEKGQIVELECRGNIFPGVVSLALRHTFGWRAEITFAQDVYWSPKSFEPRHMLNPETLKGQ